MKSVNSGKLNPEPNLPERKFRIFGTWSRLIIGIAAIAGLYAVLFSPEGVIAQYHMNVIRQCGGVAAYSFKARYQISIKPGESASAVISKCFGSIDSLSRIDSITLSLDSTDLTDDDFRFLVRIRGSAGFSVEDTKVTDKALYAVMYCKSLRIGVSGKVAFSNEAIAYYNKAKELLRRDDAE